MPKRVDHDERRRQIAEAVWRIASTRGLEDVTLRQVATEAGVSTRLVQYYFGTRQELLLGALKLLNERQQHRIEARIPASPEPRAVLREVLVGMLPVDEEATVASLVHIAYFVRAMGDAELKAAFQNPAGPSLEEIFTGILLAAAGEGLTAPGLDLAREADSLLALVGGFGPDVLLGLRTIEEVIEVVDYHLTRIFTASPGTTSTRG
ncbi:TetR/AcrR family transcriptional regulator [Amycolatopsis nigrescens]|uniref:TetR/AcrR family transcriptional regulator n=1 Tax=Amycolatopsis nigrescens TaxID=381445 RepID=UPI00036ACF5F|nr:TetR/AcrR family transcriptional regulator [Amycolatopsis nigrescens]